MMFSKKNVKCSIVVFSAGQYYMTNFQCMTTNYDQAWPGGRGGMEAWGSISSPPQKKKNCKNKSFSVLFFNICPLRSAFCRSTPLTKNALNMCTFCERLKQNFFVQKESLRHLLNFFCLKMRNCHWCAIGNDLKTINILVSIILEVLSLCAYLRSDLTNYKTSYFEGIRPISYMFYTKQFLRKEKFVPKSWEVQICAILCSLQ